MINYQVTLARWGIILALPIVLMFLPLYILSTEAFVKFEYAKPNFPPATRFTPEERMRWALPAAVSLRVPGGIDYIRALQYEYDYPGCYSTDIALYQQGNPVFNTREMKHMEDVRVVADRVQFAFGIASLVLIASLIALWRDRATRVLIPRSLLTGALVLVVLVVTIGVIAALNFQWFFVRFHRVFFAGNSWLFDHCDTLIQCFPLKFWMDAAMYWVIISLGGAVAIIVLSRSWLRAQRNHA